MTRQQLTDYRTRISDFLSARRLRDALALLRNLSETLMRWETTDEINRLEQSYAYMLRYVAQGIHDPDRDEVYNGLIFDVYRLLDSLERRALTADTPTLYFQTIRNGAITPGNPLPALVDTWFEATDRLATLMLAPDKERQSAERRRREEAQQGIFNHLWTTYPLTADDEGLVRRIMDSPVSTQALKQLVMSALTMAQIEYFDQRGMLLLMDAYMQQPAPVALRALTGIVLALYRYRRRPLTRKLAQRLDAVRDTPHWRSDLRTILLELIRTRDTERVSRKIKDEVLPEMMKLRPDIMKKIREADAAAQEGDEPELNPEWEEMIRNSGLADKMKEMGELQMEGSDVMMSTFSHLKHYPFFSEISNWFLPFDSDHTAVAEASANLGGFGVGIFENSTLICESDKYSFLLSIRDIKGAYRDAMLHQFQEQSQALSEAAASGAGDTEPENRRDLLLSYLRDVYRFFKLFRRKGEFRDPFRGALNLTKVDSLLPDIDIPEVMGLAAELYFRFDSYKEALDAYSALIDSANMSPEIYQKIGFCHQKLGQYKEALESYKRAEYTSPDSPWLIKSIATCLKRLSMHAEALPYYRRLADLNPDDVRTILNLGNAQVAVDDYESAVKTYFKAEFIENERGAGRRTWRPLAWCLLMLHDFQRARSYFDRILSDRPTPEDYFNMGHLALAEKNFPEALNYYKLCIAEKMPKATQAEAIEQFLADLELDAANLAKIGVPADILPMVADMVIYDLTR